MLRVCIIIPFLLLLYYLIKLIISYIYNYYSMRLTNNNKTNNLIFNANLKFDLFHLKLFICYFLTLSEPN